MSGIDRANAEKLGTLTLYLESKKELTVLDTLDIDVLEGLSWLHFTDPITGSHTIVNTAKIETFQWRPN